MSFADTFATELGDRTGTTVDASEFSDSDTVNTDLQALNDFLDGLGDTDRSTLDLITADNVDLTQATDDDGNPAIPGGQFLALAGTVGEPLGNLLAQAQTAFQVATEDGSQVATTETTTTNQGDFNG
jgi:hypothetical protein